MPSKTDSEVTIFERILNKELPAKIVFEDDEVLAFHDINPAAPIHVLVIPKAKIKSFKEIKDWQDHHITSFFRSIADVAHALDLDESGYRVVFNTGRHGQQTVDYIHAHILGGRPFQWPPG